MPQDTHQCVHTGATSVVPRVLTYCYPFAAAAALVAVCLHAWIALDFKAPAAQRILGTKPADGARRLGGQGSARGCLGVTSPDALAFHSSLPESALERGGKLEDGRRIRPVCNLRAAFALLTKKK